MLPGFSDMIRRSWFDLSWCDTASTNTNFSFSSQVFFLSSSPLEVLWKRTNRNDSRISSVFNFLSIFSHFSLLAEVCIHANISPGSFFMPRLWRRSMNLNNAIYFIQDLENTGKKRIKFLIHKSWRTEKVIGKNEIMSGKQIVTQAVRPVYPINGVLVLLCIWGRFSSTSTPPSGGLYPEGGFNGGFFALRVWGVYIWRSLYLEGLIFGILRYALLQSTLS